MSEQRSENSAARTEKPVRDVTEKLSRSRQRLLDLTLNNRLLKFRSGDPQYRDDHKSHKHLVVKGILESSWQSLVEEKKEIEIVGLTRDQQTQLAKEMQLQEGHQTSDQRTTLSLGAIEHNQWEDLRSSIRGVSQDLQRGNLISLLPEESFRKRLTKIYNEQNTLANSTGDSALFLAIGFLEWSEEAPHPRANEPLFAPLVLVHVALNQRKTNEGGKREFLLRMDSDEPQGNPCLVEKLRQDFFIDLPDLNIEENESATAYFTRVGRALRSKKKWRIHPTMALGFFNFARYRLWLDLDPGEWPEGQSPSDHPIVGAILDGEPLPQQAGIPDDDAVAHHQATEDLPLVMDADSTQYAALLAAQKDVSIVVQGPPGSGKSQTITNLISVAIAHGKRVLFVAQKLPALQVVQRRLESVELGAFCLPLFSDKARVTEIHKHLEKSTRLRMVDWPASQINQVPAIAKRLNGHAARLRDQPAGYNQSVCSLIQRAVAFNLFLRETWGNSWHDDLCAVTVLEVEAPAEWIEKREQVLHQWHRLRSEVGNSWANWTPLKFGPMDTGSVKTIVQQQERAAASLAKTLADLPEDLHQLTAMKIEQLVAQVRQSRVTVLKEVLPDLLRFLWQAPENAIAVARLERDLEEFSQNLIKAQQHLRFTDENRNYVSSRTTAALRAIAPVVSPRCSLGSAKAALDELNNILRLAEDLSAYANLNAKGIAALYGFEESAPEIAEIAIAWKHVEVLANHNTNSNLNLPIGAKVLIALYIQADGNRLDDVRAFGQRLLLYHQSSARLKSRWVDPAHLQHGTIAASFNQSIHYLCQHGLGKVRLCELSELESQLTAIAASLNDTKTATPRDFFTNVFGSEVPTTSHYQSLASLAAIPPALCQIPAKGTKTILLRVIGMRNASLTMELLNAAVQNHQRYYQEAVEWFPTIKLGNNVDPATLATMKQAVQTTYELGLQNQSLASIALIIEKLKNLRSAVQEVIDAVQMHFEKWQISPPKTLDQIYQAKAIFVLLVNRPQAPAGLPVETICLRDNAQSVAAAAHESNEIQLFRERNSERVSFRDLPDVETIAAQRRELRSNAGVWWRWLSNRYYQARRTSRSFLNRPFPNDEDTLILLSELETHERRRVAFQSSSIDSILGSHFKGIETKWQNIDPTLAWIREIQTVTQTSAVALFAHSSIYDMEGIRAVINIIENLTGLFEESRTELSVLTPLTFIAAAPSSINLTKLYAALVNAETLANDLAEKIQVQIRLHPQLKFYELSVNLERLESFNRSKTALEEYTQLAEPDLAGSLQTSALSEDVAWYSELLKRAVPREIIDAIISGQLTVEVHWPLINHAQLLISRIEKLQERFLDSQVPAWFSDEILMPAVESTLEQIIKSASDVRAQDLGSAFDTQLHFEEIAESLNDVAEINAAKLDFQRWWEILREDPAHLTPEQVTITIDWLDTLRSNGISGLFLQWILTEETDSRLQWWQELVSKAKNLRSRRHTLQGNFALSLNGTQSTTTLIAWSSHTADQCAKIIGALEVIESYSQSTEFTVHQLAQATSGLCRAIELIDGLQTWRTYLGGNPALVDVTQIQKHRHWVAMAHGLPCSIADWLTTADTTFRCEVLLRVENELDALKSTVNATEKHLISHGNINSDGPFSILSLIGTPHEIEQRCSNLISKISLLPQYAALLRERENAVKLGISNLIDHSEQASISTEIVIQTFHAAVAWQQAKALWEADDNLRNFQSNEHERLRSRFQQEDENQLQKNRNLIKSRICNGLVTKGIKGRTAGEHTQSALLQHEIGKKRSHLPIRKLVLRAGKAMQELCPCWMMTPLAVAQYLPPGSIHFDVVIMDEASQINPEDAWGAIARGKQLIVVGDQQQMPPSDFFMSTLEEDGSSMEDDEIDGGKSESILDASVSSLLTSTLLWHYRSRHETLIAAANSFSYDNRLILFPHPHRTHAELGIRYNYIEGAITTIGKVTNALEAEAVAKRVLELVQREFAKPIKNRLTIGVVTMNIYQQEAVNDLLDKMRQDDPRFDLAMSGLESEQNQEPLFIRNLENIQGDERDIMLISFTYGPHTPGGTPAQRFGPLNREGGERRFNVLITRAKWRMEIFTSIRSEQILVDGKREGIRDFHLFLKYAETGLLNDPGQTTNKSSDSPFEIQVEAVLRKVGFETERQIGVAGYFIDLAVKHPHHPGLYAIGVECDGATYHSSRAARDRDRLREKVLIERGWKIYRIWSTDWFVNPQQAKQRLIDAVTAACP